MRIRKATRLEFAIIASRRVALYPKAYAAIRLASIGDVLRICLDKPSLAFGRVAQGNFRGQRKVGFKLMARKMDKQGKVWLVMKVSDVTEIYRIKNIRGV